MGGERDHDYHSGGFNPDPSSPQNDTNFGMHLRIFRGTVALLSMPSFPPMQGQGLFSPTPLLASAWQESTAMLPQPSDLPSRLNVSSLKKILADLFGSGTA